MQQSGRVTRVLLVAFTAEGPDLAAGDTNGVWDVLAHDQANGRTGIVSRSGSAQGNDTSNLSDEGVGQTVSANGRFVVFTSAASNRIPGHKAHGGNVYVRDRVLNRTRLMSISTAGAIGNSGSGMPAISADGRFVVFTPAVGSSYSASISADGRYVAFESDAHNLSPEGVPGVFVRDVIAHTTRLVSVSSAGVPGDNRGGDEPMISADGRFVAYDSDADNLVPGDTNGRSDIFVTGPLH